MLPPTGKGNEMAISIVLSSRECKLIKQALRCAFDHYGADEFEQLADWITVSEMVANDAVAKQTAASANHANEVRDLICSKKG